MSRANATLNNVSEKLKSYEIKLKIATNEEDSMRMNLEKASNEKGTRESNRGT